MASSLRRGETESDAGSNRRNRIPGCDSLRKELLELRFGAADVLGEPELELGVGET
jgi:hypothetical protein